jgi:hypothetical protein
MAAGEPGRGFGPELAWRAASPLVLRMAGFPFEWLELLAAPEVSRAAGAVRRAEERVAELAERARSVGDPARSPAERAALRRISRGKPAAGTAGGVSAGGAPADGVSAPFAAAAAAHAAAVRAAAAAAGSYAEAYRLATGRSAAAVVGLFRAEPALRDMLLVSNDQVYPRLAGWLGEAPGDVSTWRKKDRSNLATLVSYLQRVCAKNDTTSHFGPLAVGRLDPTAVGVRWRPAALDRRTVLSHWAGQALAERLAEDPQVEALLQPRKAPGALLRGGTLTVAVLDQARLSRDVAQAVTVRPPVRLAGLDRRLYELCDGQATLTEIAAAAGLRRADGTPDAAAARAGIDRLAGCGAVLPGPELPYGLADPLDWLAGWLAPLPPGCPARRAWAEVRAAVDALAAAAPGQQAAVDDRPAVVDDRPAVLDRPAALAELAGTFGRLTGRPPTRGGGFYSDRSVFSEHCIGVTGDLTVGRPLTGRMTGDLALLYDMFLLRPRWRLRLERQALAQWFRGRFGTGPVPVPDYLAAFLADLTELEPRYAAIDRQVARIGEALERALLPAAGDGPAAGVHRVDREVVTGLLRRFGVAEPALCNPDLMVAAASAGGIDRGEFRLVIGDLHAIDDHLSHGSVAPFVAERFPGYRAEMLRLYAGLLAPEERLADVTQYHLNKTFPRTEPACLDIEAFDRSGRPAGQRLRLGELSVCREGDRLRLLAPSGDRLRLLVPPHVWPMLSRNPFAVFGFPVDTEGAAVHGAGRSWLPRIEVGDVVLQRALWRVPAAELAAAGTADDAGAFGRLQATRCRLRWPRHLYARCPGEPKPVYCDLDSPLLVRHLGRLAAATPAGALVTLSEMLPGPAELWLADAHGHRTAEIRYGVFTTTGRG